MLDEQGKQTTPKPERHDDGLAEAWIMEWIGRVTAVSNNPLKNTVAPPQPENPVS